MPEIVRPAASDKRLPVAFREVLPSEGLKNFGEAVVRHAADMRNAPRVDILRLLEMKALPQESLTLPSADTFRESVTGAKDDEMVIEVRDARVFFRKHRHIVLRLVTNEQLQTEREALLGIVQTATGEKRLPSQFQEFLWQAVVGDIFRGQEVKSSELYPVLDQTFPQTVIVGPLQVTE